MPSPNEGQNTATADTKFALITATRTEAQIRIPHNAPAGIIILTLEANNIQVQTHWRVTSAADSFAITNGTLSLTPESLTQAGILVATIYAVDEFRQLNTAYDNLTAIALITVEIRANISLAMVPPLMIFAGDTSPLHTLAVTGGGNNKTFAIVDGNTDGYFTLSNNGILAAKAGVAANSYLLVIDVRDEYDQRASVSVMVDVAAVTLALSGLNVFLHNGDTVFHFATDDATQAQVINDYYIYYNGNYYQNNGSYWDRGDTNPSSHQLAVDGAIDTGSDTFELVHKSNDIAAIGFAIGFYARELESGIADVALVFQTNAGNNMYEIRTANWGVTITHRTIAVGADGYTVNGNTVTEVASALSHAGVKANVEDRKDDLVSKGVDEYEDKNFVVNNVSIASNFKLFQIYQDPCQSVDTNICPGGYTNGTPVGHVITRIGNTSYLKAHKGEYFGAGDPDALPNRNTLQEALKFIADNS